MYHIHINDWNYFFWFFKGMLLLGAYAPGVLNKQMFPKGNWDPIAPRYRKGNGPNSLWTSGVSQVGRCLVKEKKICIHHIVIT